MNKIDRRVVKTLRLIDQTCYDLLATTAFERLSIAEICQEAEIGRSTFYQYYLDKYDWLEKQVARYTASFQELMNPELSNQVQHSQPILINWSSLVEIG